VKGKKCEESSCPPERGTTIFLLQRKGGLQKKREKEKKIHSPITAGEGGSPNIRMKKKKGTTRESKRRGHPSILYPPEKENPLTQTRKKGKKRSKTRKKERGKEKKGVLKRYSVMRAKKGGKMARSVFRSWKEK